MTERPQCPPGCRCGRHRHIVRTRHEKQCEECGQSFTAKRIDARFCSGDCHRKSYEREHRDQIRKVKREWQQANREKAREIQRRYQERHGERDAALKRQRREEDAADPVKAALKREKSRQYYLANRERLLAQKKRDIAESYKSSRRSTHGVDWDVLFSSLWDAQDGKCYLCGGQLDQESPKAIHLDHDHACCPLGRTCERCRRGLACSDCNNVLGRVRDDPARLRRMADALEIASEAVALRMQQPRKSREPLTRDLECENCGKMFTAYRSDNMCCSSSCYYKLRYRTRKADQERTLACLVCETPFKSAGSRAKYCSPECSLKASRIRRGLAATPPAPVAEAQEAMF